MKFKEGTGWLHSEGDTLDLIISNYKINCLKPKNLQVSLKLLSCLSRIYLEGQGYRPLKNRFKETVGAATLSWNTLKSLRSKAGFKSFWFQHCHRPWDMKIRRFGVNLHSRSSLHTQLQIIERPNLDFEDIRFRIMDFLSHLGLNPLKLTFHEDHWSNTSIGAYGRGFEGRYDGVEIVQATIFHKYLFEDLNPVSEIVFGLERLLFVILRSHYSHKIKKVPSYPLQDRFYAKVASGKSKWTLNKVTVNYLRNMELLSRSSEDKIKDSRPWDLVLCSIHLYNLADLMKLNGCAKLWMMKLLKENLEGFLS